MRFEGGDFTKNAAHGRLRLKRAGQGHTLIEAAAKLVADQEKAAEVFRQVS